MRFLHSNKVSTLLRSTANFFFAYGKRKPLFQPFEVGWLSPKLAAILARPKQLSDVTGCITLMPRCKVRVIMGEGNTVWSLPNNILRTSRSWKVDNDSSLRHEEVESWSWGFPVYSIGYFQDILCKQANECEFLNRKMIGTLGQMATTQSNNIYSHKVKNAWKQEKAAFEIIIRSAAARIAATTLRVFESLIASRKPRTLCEFHRRQDYATVTFSPVVSATSYKLSQQQ